MQHSIWNFLFSDEALSLTNITARWVDLGISDLSMGILFIDLKPLKNNCLETSQLQNKKINLLF